MRSQGAMSGGLGRVLPWRPWAGGSGRSRDEGVEGEGFCRVGDNRLVCGRPVDVVRAEEPAVSGGDSGGQSADVARLRRDAEVEELHHPEGVVLHDSDAKGRAPAAVALGLRVREARAKEADEVNGADPAA